MPNLLTPGEEQQIRDGFKDVFDTFAGPGTGTEITIRVTNDISWNPNAPFGEKRDLEYTDHVLPAMVMYNNGVKNKEDPNFAGVWDNADVKCLVHLDYVDAAGLITNDGLNFSENSAILLIDLNGSTEVYRMVHASIDGALGKTQIYMVVIGEKEEKKAT